MSTSKYKYTEEGCFTGELLKKPPFPADDPKVILKMKGMIGTRRRWLHYGCAVEELGRWGYYPVSKCKITESALVWHLLDQLASPQKIENNDGVGAAVRGATREEHLFDSRFVLVHLSDHQISAGISKLLEDYFGFKQLAPFFSNTKHYSNSRIGLYGLCTTRYVIDDKEKDIGTSNTTKTKG